MIKIYEYTMSLSCFFFYPNTYYHSKQLKRNELHKVIEAGKFSKCNLQPFINAKLLI